MQKLYHLSNASNGVRDANRSSDGNYQNHHIATDKHSTEYTPKLKKYFDNADMDISKSKENIVEVFNHQGPHPDEYHEYILRRLSQATKGLKAHTEKYTNAIKKVLDKLGEQSQTPGTYLNKLITK